MVDLEDMSDNYCSSQENHKSCVKFQTSDLETSYSLIQALQLVTPDRCTGCYILCRDLKFWPDILDLHRRSYILICQSTPSSDALDSNPMYQNLFIKSNIFDLKDLNPRSQMLIQDPRILNVDQRSQILIKDSI